jgi:hypothetical protein
MALIKFLTISSLLLLLSACAQQPRIEYVELETPIEIKGRPRPISMQGVRWWVVTQENMESFLERFGKENGETVYIAISVKDYENLSLNMAEIKRFLEQQNNIIVYYEDSINKTNTEEAGQ